MPFSQAAIVDGYTQPGAKANTLANGDDRVILVRLNSTIGSTTPVLRLATTLIEDVRRRDVTAALTTLAVAAVLGIALALALRR